MLGEGRQARNFGGQSGTTLLSTHHVDDDAQELVPVRGKPPHTAEAVQGRIRSNFAVDAERSGSTHRAVRRLHDPELRKEPRRSQSVSIGSVHLGATAV